MKSKRLNDRAEAFPAAHPNHSSSKGQILLQPQGWEETFNIDLFPEKEWKSWFTINSADRTMHNIYLGGAG